MDVQSRSGRSPFAFIIVVFVLSVPIWFIGPLVERILSAGIPVNLPVSSLMGFCPMIAALIMVRRENGSAGVKALLKRTFDFRRIQNRVWYLPIVLLMPFIMVLEFGLLNLMGRPMPDPRVPILEIPIFFLLFFIEAIGEQLGWSGYATDPLQERWSALGAALFLGLVWAVWHIIPFIQAHHPAAWIVGQCSTQVVLRVLTAWIYNNTGKSVFATIIFHAMSNVSELLFPNYGSYYDPFLTAILFAVAAATVTLLWGPKTLARYRHSGAH